ncbi:NUDIX hydrolase [Allomuricauda sp. SCSIO 65647]|uniref:NUDIX hydrolase n=1 Tax=Allomuricauda sp. SCSIO 65647 TaxID=2908843 RepID=UPI001F249252|nr:NUDIX domain-containing protein [Muricauda sp. SCSIO 65647]UJH68098.1 NUDIX domain-containing protein [Muricauda sp. SCSIO 65647]
MYKVFVNEFPLILTTKKPHNANGILFEMDADSILKAIESLSKKKIKEAYIYDPSDTILEHFSAKIPMVLAAGGVVKNKKGKILFIYRNNKWDLPKGKLDKGESIENAAVREVEEETGVKNLVVDKYLHTTYHIFKHNGNFRLKQTYWFAMRTDFEGKLKAEKAEGITKAKWKGPKKTKKALKNSYQNIRELFESGI